MNPKNWSKRKKWMSTIIVSAFTFMAPMSSSMVAPALTVIGRELNITNEVKLSLILSIFVLAWTFGTLIFGLLSEVYGRVLIL